MTASQVISGARKNWKNFCSRSLIILFQCRKMELQVSDGVFKYVCAIYSVIVDQSFQDDLIGRFVAGQDD